VKWFPDKRGFAVGLTAAGIGAAAALTVVPIRLTILSAGYQQAFLWFGIGQALVLILISRVLQGPEPPSVLALNPNIRLPQNDRVRPAPRCCVRRFSGCCMRCPSAFLPAA
jgi:OFA family oxalate/formate antiporter-like MFS transporter